MPLLTADDARLLSREIEAEGRRVPGLIDRPKGAGYWNHLGKSFAWYKSLHAHVAAARQVASLPVLVAEVQKLLGPELILWGCELIRKGAGASHRWHVDTECEGHGLTVWLPLENVGPQSGIKFVERSHHIPVSPQKLMVTEGLDLDDDGAVLDAGRRFDPSASIHTPRVGVGEFVIFPGALWHASFNQSSTTRSVLVLQYSPVGSAVRIPCKFLPPVEWHVHEPPVLRIDGSP